MLRRYKLLLSLVIFAITSINASANSEWVNAENIRARFVDEGGKYGVEFSIRPNWHTYYKVPGDTGMPTQFDFKGSTNFDNPQVTFPEYKVIKEYGFTANAYEGTVFFPVKADVKEGAHVNLDIIGSVCSEICIPYELKINYDPKMPPIGDEDGLSLYILFIALFAGFILNIMPCVLPVLSLKVLSVLKQSGKTRKHARFNFLATSAGIISSFIALALITIGLRSAGMAVGWGLHFQSPIFVGILMLITLAFAVSLFGFFHLNPPSWLSGSGEHKDSFTGNFFSGVIATLLGTSCTAPVLVTAVSYALAGDVPTILVMFTVMGIGMALPFLIFALRPSLVNYLPKPGKWMVKVKYFMGVLLLGTAIWLGCILFSQLAGNPGIPDEGTIAFDEQKIEELVNDGQVVFVDISAEWCVNCKANKIRVLNTESMQSFFKDNHVIQMEGDLTKPNPTILKYLRGLNLYGIPVNIVYGPNAKNGIMLATLISQNNIERAVHDAAAH